MCELCNILDNIITQCYGKYLDCSDPFVIVDCKSCRVPMVVFVSHEEPSKPGLRYAVKVATQLFPNRRIDMNRRKVSDHPHFHMR